ncbi:MAG: RagB/SusD family nutrient uptake outer membrane protein [Tannerellaceae bacterium]|jgi:tetratricopeptide (TPR) repeat protein|nr:RagB/SusD family nutrient uptake outer membrane protein [Tannerellaceae bacterium]
MKTNNLIYSILVSLPILFSGCSDFLDRNPVDALSPATFWNTESDAYLAMVGCYNGLEPIYGGYNMMYWDCTSDNLFNYFSWEGRKPIANGDMNPSNTGTDYFTFIDIRSCNEYLQNENKVEWSTTAKQEQYKAEVRSVRALLYFWKTEWYGDFPLITEVIETPDEAKIGQTDAASVRQFVAEELQAAIPHLPNKNQTVEGRVNKQTAQAALMRYYLYRGDYNKALTYAQDIEASGEVSLPDMSYADAFLVANQYNSETIFNHTYIGGTSMNLYLPPFMPNAIGGWSSVIPTMDLADAYEMRDGRTIEEAQLTGDYDPANPFVNRDPRLRATILYPGQKYTNYEAMPDGCYNSMPQYFKDGSRNNDYWSNADNASKSGLQFKKFLQTLDQFSDVNSATMRVPVFRYAEVLLTMAECYIELNQDLDKAISYINKVRVRAGMPEVDRTKYNNQPALRELLRRERRVEFAGEGLRRADLIRWGELVSKLNGFEIRHFDGDVTSELNADGDYNVNVTGRTVIGGQTYKVQEYHRYLPINHEKIKLSDNNLKQNQGY